MELPGCSPRLLGEVCGQSVISLLRSGRTRDACDCLNAAIAMGEETEKETMWNLVRSVSFREALVEGDAVQILDWLASRGYVRVADYADYISEHAPGGSRLKAYVEIATDPGLSRARSEAPWSLIPPLFLCVELFAVFMLSPGVLPAIGCFLVLGLIWVVRSRESCDRGGWERRNVLFNQQDSEKPLPRHIRTLVSRKRPSNPPSPRVYISNDYCSACARPKYQGQTHCRYCKRCTRDFDHHCMWYNCCIHRGNYPPFLASVGCLLVLVLSALVSLAVGYRTRGSAPLYERLLSLCQFFVFAMLTNTAMLHLRKVLKRKRLVR